MLGVNRPLPGALRGASGPPVTLQINLAPTDLPTAVHTVPHQLRQWGRQVDEVLFVVDLHRSRGKFAEGWEERLPGLRRLIEDCCAGHPHARSVDVDYSWEARTAVERYFFSGEPMPAKDYRGAPFSAYFSALLAASHDHVLHFDSDMLFGGGSQTWLAEALQILETRPDVLACNPLPGPPQRMARWVRRRCPGSRVRRRPSAPRHSAPGCSSWTAAGSRICGSSGRRPGRRSGHGSTATRRSCPPSA